jgi:hypothetical protein
MNMQADILTPAAIVRRDSAPPQQDRRLLGSHS